MPNRPRLFIDFDGTISAEDTTDLLFERFADPEWRAVEAAWSRGDIGSRECMALQVDLLRVTPDALDGFLADIRIDPGFDAFMALCREHGLPVTVLSDGLDRVARGVLRRIGVEVPVLSNRLHWQGGDRWRLDFPHARPGCASAAGNCKCARLESRPDGSRSPTVLIGDGRSDFCGAAAAGAVFAKGRLMAHCQARAIPHTGFEGFADLTPVFGRWLDSAVRTPALAGRADAPRHPA